MTEQEKNQSLRAQLDAMNIATYTPKEMADRREQAAALDMAELARKLYSAGSATIGDVNSNAKGSGARYNGGKPDFSLIPMCTLEDEARVWAYGKQKYAAWNWAKGADWDVPLASMLRHLAAWQRGEDNDPESGLPHLAHIACNVRMLTLYSKTYPEGDNRPKEWLK